jgi:hypothetical protein
MNVVHNANLDRQLFELMAELDLFLNISDTFYKP